MTLIECPIATCGFDHTVHRGAAAPGIEHVLPDGAVLAGGGAAERHDAVGAHLRRHTVRDWAEEIVRLRRILTDPDSQVAAAREAQQLALAQIRRLTGERDAALDETGRLRGRLAELRNPASGGAARRVNPTATCPVCVRDFLLRRDGRIRMHNQPGKQQACPGSHALINGPAARAA